MALTATNIPRITTDIQTNHPVFQRPQRITLDNSYPIGGYPHGQAYTVLGATVIAKNAEARKYNLDFDASAGKFIVSEPVAPLIVEEAITVSSNAGQMSRVPAYILAIQVTAGSVTGAFRPIPVGKTPVTTQVAVNFLTGALTFLAGDAVTAVRITYIPLGVGPFVEANRVVDEPVTLATAGVNLANRAALIQYVWNDAASGAARTPTIVPVGKSPGSNEIAIDIQNAGNTTITPNSGQNGNAALATYWKFTEFAKFGWTDQADIAVSSNAIALSEVIDLPSIWIPAFGTVIVGETGASANLQARLVGPSGSVAANVAVYDPSKNTLTFNGADSYSTIEVPYLLLNAALLDNTFAEVPIGTNLAAVSFDALLYMRRS